MRWILLSFMLPFLWSQILSFLHHIDRWRGLGSCAWSGTEAYFIFMYWVCSLGDHVGLLPRCRMVRKRTIVWLCIFGGTGTEQRSAAYDCSDTVRFLYYFGFFPPGKLSAFSSQIPKDATGRGINFVVSFSFQY
jgi:hypothetical protein